MKDEKINDYNHNNRRMSKIRLIVFIISILIFIAAAIMLKYYINIEKKYYNSLQEIAASYYPDENAVYLEKGNYCYIIVDSESIAREEFVFKTTEEKYIVFKNLISESFNRKRYFQYKDIVAENFYSFVHVELHGDYCIILLERYFVNDNKVDVIVYDSFEQIQPIETYSREYYFKVLEMSSIDEHYELRVDIGDDTFILINSEEIGKAR